MREKIIDYRRSLAITEFLRARAMFDIRDLLGIPEKISNLVNMTRGALLGQPDEAAEKMAWVIDEISKIYAFIETETVNYLSLVFLADGANLVEGRRALL